MLYQDQKTNTSAGAISKFKFTAVLSYTTGLSDGKSQACAKSLEEVTNSFVQKLLGLCPGILCHIMLYGVLN